VRRADLLAWRSLRVQSRDIVKKQKGKTAKRRRKRAKAWQPKPVKPKVDRWAASREARRQRAKIAVAVRGGQTLADVAKQFGVTRHAILQACRENGYYISQHARPGERVRHRLSPEEWRAVDWTLYDAEIARRYDVSRERVRQVRKELEQPPVYLNPNYHRKPGSGRRAFRVGKAKPLRVKPSLLSPRVLAFMKLGAKAFAPQG
jgi:hypothetical protein